jgi:N utilization substance protein B
MASGRHGARRLLVQALYQHQVGGHGHAELAAQFSGREEFRRADSAYFLLLLEEILANEADLDGCISRAADRPVAQLDPVERGILWIGIAELRFHVEVPAGVIINEAVELAKEYGAQDSHRYVNAVLDQLAAALRGQR